jgi:predicted phage gp36 major capsid-like protein
LRGRSIAFSSLSYSPFGSLPPSSSASPSVISEASPDSSRQAQLSRLMELGEQRQKALLEEQVRVLRDKVEAKDGELQDARDLLARAQEDRSRTKLCTL